MTYLKSVEENIGWDAEKQINEYAAYLLFLALNNEIFYNSIDRYRVKKRNLISYLNDSFFKSALKNVKACGFKKSFVIFCFKYKFVFPLHLYGKIKKYH